MSTTKTNIAVLFPGQGSQSVGMLAELASNHAIIQKTFDAASHILGYDLWELSQQDPQQQLNQTEFTQPALLASGVAIWRLLQETFQLTPAFMAGHSLGEYTALTCANALDFADAVRLVQLRGHLMQQAAPGDQGAMAAIAGLDEQQVSVFCHELSQSGAQVAPANFNGTGQTVVAGHRTAVEAVLQKAMKAGARLAKIIPVSVPAHSFFMHKIAPQFEAALAAVEIQSPKIPVIQNLDAMPHHDPAHIKKSLVEQLYSPVQWTKTLHYLAQHHIELLLEAGPGKVLAGLAKRTIPQVSCVCINTEANLQSIKSSFETIP